MFGGISLIGWFHTILGTAAIVVGLYLLIRDKFIYIDNKLAYFYLISTAANMCVFISFIWGHGFF